MMSALLTIEAAELNIYADYDACNRAFRRDVLFLEVDEYKSCMFLVYKTKVLLPNKETNYRNHFTLFRNDKSLIVVRSETSLELTDVDAILQYHIITPISGQCSRIEHKRWTISFDKIEYSRQPPFNFLTYSLICSGEWWYFENGIILNGVASNELADSMFIYYELHPKYKINQPTARSWQFLSPHDSQQTPFIQHLMSNTPLTSNALSTVTVSPTPNVPETTKTGTQSIDAASQTTQQHATSQLQSQPPAPIPEQPQVHSQTPPTSQLQLPVQLQIPNPTQIQSQTQQQSQPQSQVQTQPQPQIHTQAHLQLREQSQTQTTSPLTTQSQSLQPLRSEDLCVSYRNVATMPRTIGTLNPNIVLKKSPHTTIRQNGSTKTPEVHYTAIVPSFYWFSKRDEELQKCNINYFIP